MEQDSKATSPLYVIYSGKSLDDIRDFLANLGNDFAELRVVRKPNREGTNRSLVLLTPQFYESLRAKGYDKYNDGFSDDFSVRPYNLHDSDHPKSGSQTYTWYIPIPEGLSKHEVKTVLDLKLESLVKFGLFEAQSYQINIPLKSRETGDHDGYAIVSFKDSVSRDALAAGRLLCHDSRWGACFDKSQYDETNIFKCWWFKAKERKPVSKPKVVSAKDLGIKLTPDVFKILSDIIHDADDE